MGWKEEFRQHTVWPMASETLDRARMFREQGEFPGDDSRLDLLVDLLARLKGFQSSPDPTITSRDLEDVAELLNGILYSLPHLPAIFKPMEQGSLPLFDRLANVVGRWPRPAQGRLKEFAEELQSARSNLESAAVQMSDRVLSIEERATRAISGVEAVSEASQERLEAAVLTLRERTAELDSVRSEMQKQAEDQRSRIDKAIRDNYNELRNREKERERIAIDTQLQREEEWATITQRLEERTREHFAMMNATESKSKKVLEAVGINSTAHDFGSHASSEKGTANIWRIVATAVFAVAGVWFVASSFLIDAAGEVWETSLARLGVTAAIAVAGLYAARESSQHRRQERRAKQIELVLTALEPFIANLPEEDQNSVRIASAQSIFVLQADSDSTSSKDTREVLDLVRALTERFPTRTP